MGRRVTWPAHPSRHHLLGPLDPGVGVGVDPTTEGVEDVLVAPDHPFGQAGRPAGIEDVVVVVGPRGEVALGTANGHRLLEGDRPLGQRHSRPVLDAYQEPEPRQLGQELGHLRSVLGLVYQGHQVGVGEQVAELVLHVAVVDVDPDRSQLEHGPRRLDPLDAVERVDADVVAGPDALVGEEVGQAVGPVLHLGEGPALPCGQQVLPVAEGVHGRLEQVSEVERHRPVSRTRFC